MLSEAIWVIPSSRFVIASGLAYTIIYELINTAVSSNNHTVIAVFTIKITCFVVTRRLALAIRNVRFQTSSSTGWDVAFPVVIRALEISTGLITHIIV